uniref:tRNA (Guanine(37)-N1)-methyltransferase n=1 Tax=Aceria tosichella TaxID=561515 RepID=A0A6G1SCQ1_9ACAR
MHLDEMAAKAFGLTSFTAVGHLIHINLRDNLLQHKHEIGEALLRNNSRALAVVNKVNSIDNAYRNFDIEIIAKRQDCPLTDEELMVCEVNENKCRFKLDFSKVYWNSRLCTEHERIISKLNKSHDIVFDLFAGVGPFSVPAAKAKCTVYANDLNPESIKWLRINMERNKIPRNMYEIYNEDAKDFILNEMKQKLLDIYDDVEEEEPAIKPRIHILMNLPALAPTFLPYFSGLLNDVDADEQPPSTSDRKTTLQVFKEQSLDHVVYCYCFLKGAYENPKHEVQKMIEDNFGRKLTNEQLVEIFKVRNVAPFKDMYRVSIKLDEAILFSPKELVGIMKKTAGDAQPVAPVTNGYSKKMTSMDTQGTKRLHENSSTDESTDVEVETTKRAKISDYCAIM